MSFNRVKYTGLDFDTHLDDLLFRMQVQFAADFNDFALSSQAIMLLDLQAFGADALSFYLDRRASDNYLATARTRKTAARLARQLGYKPVSATSSSVDLSIALSEVHAFDVPIPKGFQFQGPNGLIFEASQTVTFTAGSGPTDFETVPCYEGVTLSETFTSNGTANQVFNLRRLPDSTYLIKGTVSAIVDGASYREVDFLEFGATQQFEADYQTAQIRFGDGEVGVIPPTGATILITYVASRGKAGQAPGGTIESPVQPLVVSFTNIDLIIEQNDKATGGDDLESIESIRTYAGRVFKSRKVAVTAEDYETLSTAYADPLFGRVAVARAFTPRDASVDLELQNQLNTINSTFSGFTPAVTAELTAALASLDDLDTALASLSTNFSSIGSKISEIISGADACLALLRAARSNLQEVNSESTNIQTTALTLKTAINALPTNTPSQLTSADKTLYIGYIDAMSASAIDITSLASSATSGVASSLTALAEVKDDSNDIGTSIAAPSSLLLTAETQRAAGVTASSEIRTNTTTTQTLIVDDTATVGAATLAIENHFSRILSADCQTNLVTVPILTRDASGFYVAPSIGLINSLKNFLEARNDVTHVVDVVSGEGFLIPAVITVRVGIRPGVSSSIIKTTIAAVVDSILRGRKFGDSLYESEFTPLKNNIPGVVFVNVRITGYVTELGTFTDKIDSDGNLIIGQNEVVTKGTVTILEPEVINVTAIS